MTLCGCPGHYRGKGTYERLIRRKVSISSRFELLILVVSIIVVSFVASFISNGLHSELTFVQALYSGKSSRIFFVSLEI